MKNAASESSSTLASQAQSHGLRSQLGHLLPKHALFQVHVLIDNVSNVPLINGEFAVRWKFKNVQSGSGLFSKMKGTRSWSAGRRKGKGRARDIGLEIAVTPADGEEEEDAAEEGDSSAQEDEPDDDDDDDADAATDEHIILAERQLSTSPPASPTALRPPLLSPSPALHAANSSTSVESRSVARGMTRWARLQSYNAKWEHMVNVVVQMDVHRETGDLLPNEMKLVVMQKVVPGDPDSPRRPRIGAIYLNLAEYANAGPVTRRYLLRQSKINATMRLTIELEHVGGEKKFKPPPLRKGEILASVSGLLSNNELLRTSVARQLDEFTRDDSHLSPNNSLDFDDPTTARPRVFPVAQPRDIPFVTRDGHVDNARLATSYGLRSTENLIEALFNPVPSPEGRLTPFTYCTSESEPDGSSYSDSLSIGAEQLSLNSADSISAHTGSSISGDVAESYNSTGTGSSSRPGNNRLEPSSGQPAWWRKMRSPSTPMPRQMKGSPSPAAPSSSLPQDTAIPTR